MIVFPKEENQLINEINNYYKNEEYNKIVELENEVIEKSHILFKLDKKIIIKFIASVFMMREFEKVVSLTEEFKKRDIESFEIYYYTLFSLIATEDLFYAKSVIKKMKILEESEYKNYVGNEDALYSSIFSMNKDDLIKIGPCLILINFVNELIVETMNKDIDKDYLMIRLFDLLNLLYEYGIDDDIINLFTKSVGTIYEIPMV